MTPVQHNSIGKEDESFREKDLIETYQQGQQGIQEPAKRRPTIEETNPQLGNGQKQEEIELPNFIEMPRILNDAWILNLRERSNNCEKNIDV